MLPKKTVDKFIKIYKKEFGVKLEYEKAEIMALKLINFIKLIYAPKNSELNGDNKQKRQEI